MRVDDGGPPVYVPAGAELDGSPRAAVLVCPFDSLLWDRPFVERLFGFDPRMEIYKRPHERIYGYYVLPLLLGDRLVGRADLKTNGEGSSSGAPPRAGQRTKRLDEGSRRRCAGSLQRSARRRCDRQDVAYDAAAASVLCPRVCTSGAARRASAASRRSRSARR